MQIQPLAECQTTRRDAAPFLQAALEAGRVVFNADAYPGFVTAAASGSCFDDTYYNAEAALMTGVVAAGEGCFLNAECAGETERGASCAGGADDGSPSCGTCELSAALAGNGQSCEAALCSEGLACNENHACGPRSHGKAVGEACSIQGQGPTRFLQSDCSTTASLVCVNSVCQEMQTAAEGEPCNLSTGIFCADNLVCPMGGANETCRVAGQVGDNCHGNDVIYPCANDLICADGVCAAKRPVSAECNSGSQCVSGSCSDHLCVAATSPSSDAYEVCGG
jgi:hypothetical protein